MTLEEIIQGLYRGDSRAIKEAIKILEQQPSEDCVSRKAILEMIEQIEDAGGFIGCSTYSEARYQVNNMSLVTPTHGTCKGCKHYYIDEDGHGYHCEKFDYTRFPVYADFYCADYEKRGNENESIN